MVLARASKKFEGKMTGESRDPRMDRLALRLYELEKKRAFMRSPVWMELWDDAENTCGHADSASWGGVFYNRDFELN